METRCDFVRDYQDTEASTLAFELHVRNCEHCRRETFVMTGALAIASATA